MNPARKDDPRLPDGTRLDYPAPYPHGDDADPADYARFARELWDEQEDGLAAIHDVWVQNLLFLSGRQWWRPNGRGEWRPEPVPEWREQPVSNICLAFYRTYLAKATKQRPAWQVVPASTDPDDIHAAELAEEVLEAKWLELRLANALRRAVTWTITTGNAFLYPYWNTQTGKLKPLTTPIEIPVIDPETGAEATDPMTGEPQLMEVECPCNEMGEPLLGADGRPDLEAEPAIVDEGDVGVRVYSPFQVRVSPGAEHDDDVNWVIIAEVMLLRDVARQWPEHAGELKAEELGRLEDYDRMLGTFMGGSDTQLLSPADRRDDKLQKTLVLHYHEKPTPEYPDGRYWCSAGEDVLLEEPGPLPDGIWPCVIHMTDVVVPGRYYASATMEAIVGLNREYNEINGQVKEHHNLLSRGKWIVEKGTGVKKGAITTQPGEVIQVNTGTSGGIKQADLKPLPAPVYMERERVMADIERVSGMHQASMGKAPPGVTAGVALLQLQEADDTDMGPFLAMVEESVADLASSIISIIKERYTDERLIHVAGPNRRYLAKTFRGADLDGAVDVRAITESSTPWSRSARQAMLIEIASTLPGVFTDPETQLFDTAKFARLLPIGGLESLTDAEDIDVQEALREEEMFADFGIIGQELPMVEFWQNHRVHARQHARLLKSGKFKEWTPEAQAQFLMHVQQHEMEVQAAMAAQMAQQIDPATGQPIPADPNADPNAAPPQEDPFASEEMMAPEQLPPIA